MMCCESEYSGKGAESACAPISFRGPPPSPELAALVAALQRSWIIVLPRDQRRDYHIDVLEVPDDEAEST